MRILCIVSLMVVLAGCKGAKEAAVARVGRAVITESEFQQKLGEVSPDYQNYVLTPYGRKQFLDILIREKMIIQAAQADGVAALPEFKDRMRQAHQEAEERLNQARDYLLARLWFEKLRKGGVLAVTDGDVQDYHKKHPTEVLARHILVPTPEEAEAVLREVRGRGAAVFAAKAKKSSLDADTAGDGGKMRPALFGEIIPELEVVFKMRVGEAGGPIRSKFGYHVVLKEGESNVSLDAVKDRVRNILEKAKLDKHLQSLEGSIPVEVIDAQFK
jgi:parvulin-like peptidyl-prolyl isomerase